MHTIPTVPSEHWLFKAALQMRKDSIGHMMASQKKLGDIYCLNVPGTTLLSIHDPDFIKHVLVTENKRYRKDYATRMLSLALGNGLLTSEGEFWMRQRRIAQPAFHRERLANMVSTMVSSTQELLQRWETAPREMDISQEMMVLTSDIAARALFGANVSDNLAFGKALLTAMRFVTNRFRSLAPLPMWLPTGSNLTFKKALGILDNSIQSMITGRRKETMPRHDLLAMLMDAEDEETGERMDDKQLRDEVMTLYSAGHETSANGLTWTFYLLDQNPDILEKLLEEIDRVLGGRVPTLQDLQALTYTMQVIQESLRMYPPAWAVGREAIDSDEIGGYPIEKGSMVVMCIYALHRREACWTNPDEFDPDRFLPEAVKARHRYAYLPFGGGPRFCIGSHFALMEMQVVLAMVLQRHRLNLTPGHQVEKEALITLRPKHGMRMNVRPARS